jgi:hypothetical protein
MFPCKNNGYNNDTANGDRILPRIRWFGQIVEDMKKRGKSWQEIKKESL